MALTTSQITARLTLLRDLVRDMNELEQLQIDHAALSPNRFYEQLKIRGKVGLGVIHPRHMRAVVDLFGHILEP